MKKFFFLFALLVGAVSCVEQEAPEEEMITITCNVNIPSSNTKVGALISEGVVNYHPSSSDALYYCLGYFNGSCEWQTLSSGNVSCSSNSCTFTFDVPISHLSKKCILKCSLGAVTNGWSSYSCYTSFSEALKSIPIWFSYKSNELVLSDLLNAIQSITLSPRNSVLLMKVSSPSDTSLGSLYFHDNKAVSSTSISTSSSCIYITHPLVNDTVYGECLIWNLGADVWHEGYTKTIKASRGESEESFSFNPTIGNVYYKEVVFGSIPSISPSISILSSKLIEL